MGIYIWRRVGQVESGTMSGDQSTEVSIFPFDLSGDPRSQRRVFRSASGIVIVNMVFLWVFGYLLSIFALRYPGVFSGILENLPYFLQGHFHHFSSIGSGVEYQFLALSIATLPVHIWHTAVLVMVYRISALDGLSSRRAEWKHVVGLMLSILVVFAVQ